MTLIPFARLLRSGRFRLMLASLSAGSVGCHSLQTPVSLLPGVKAAQQDRAIVAHASQSGFPSPEEVGLEMESLEN